MNIDDPEDRTVACAEFVLGTLTGPERDAFLAELARDPALQAEVGYWQDRLLGLSTRAPALEPSPDVWQRIETSLDAPTLSRPVIQAPPPLQLDAGAARDYNQRSRRSHERTPWTALNFWRMLSAVSMTAALLLAVMLTQRQPAVPDVQYVAVLQSPDQQRAGWVVRASERGPVRLVPLGDPGPVPGGRAWQFWTKGKDAAGPTSLGLVPADGRVEVPRDRLPDLGDEQLFEITLEPAAGSPIGRPTGPILFVGRASRI